MTPMPSTSGPPGSVKYGLPTAAVVVGALGLCLCPLSLVGAVMGLIALLRINKEPQLAGKTLAIIALVLPVALVPVIGIQAAIAIPNFIRFQARSKQAECKVNLKLLWTAQQAFKAQAGHYAATVEELGAPVPSGNRYAYYLSPSGTLAPDPKLHPDYDEARYEAALARLHVDLGERGGGLAMACVGNVDQDADLDVWDISSEPGEDMDGMTVPAGSPRHLQDDVRLR